jgi:hypothetical protein
MAVPALLWDIRDGSHSWGGYGSSEVSNLRQPFSLTDHSSLIRELGGLVPGSSPLLTVASLSGTAGRRLSAIGGIVRHWLAIHAANGAIPLPHQSNGGQTSTSSSTRLYCTIVIVCRRADTRMIRAAGRMLQADCRIRCSIGLQSAAGMRDAAFPGGTSCYIHHWGRAPASAYCLCRRRLTGQSPVLRPLT